MDIDLIKYENSLLVSSGDYVYIPKKEGISLGEIETRIRNGIEYYHGQITSVVKTKKYIDEYLDIGVYEVLTDDVNVIMIKDNGVPVRTTVNYREVSLIPDSKLGPISYEIRLKMYNDALNNLTVKEDKIFERKIDCSLKEYVLKHKLLYSGRDLRYYKIGDIINLNISDDTNTLTVVKDIEVINGLPYLVLILSDSDKIKTINNPDILIDKETVFLKVKIDSLSICSNRSFIIKTKNKISGFDETTLIGDYINEKIVPNIKQELILGQSIFKFLHLQFRIIDDNNISINSIYTAPNGVYIDHILDIKINNTYTSLSSEHVVNRLLAELINTTVVVTK